MARVAGGSSRASGGGDGAGDGFVFEDGGGREGSAFGGHWGGFRFYEVFVEMVARGGFRGDLIATF